MIRPTRVIGVGQRFAGDDAAGLAVLELIRQLGVPDGLELIEVAEPSAVIPLLSQPVEIILVDAVLGDPAGEVVELSLDELARCALQSWSSHGIGLAEAVQLGRQLSPPDSPSRVRFVAIRIAPPRRQTTGLSAEVAAGVREAARRIIAASRAS